MKHIEKLKKYGKKTITKTDLENLFVSSSDEELFGIIDALTEQQILSPIKGSKTNGNRVYPIYLKYKVSLPQDTYETELEEINALHPLLLKNGYLQSKPDEYKKYRSFLQKLDCYLFERKENKISISRKERSFEIFDEEKALDNKSFSALLERIGMTANVLGFYDTPEYCFNDYIPERKAEMTLLICENKDIWFNIRRMMFENHTRKLFDTHIDGVVYGCGNKISGLGALTTYPVADLPYYEEYYDNIFIPEEAERAHCKAAITKRNQWLVDNSDLLIAFVEKETGGAAACLKMAQKANIEVYRI